jgi:hypothetical protein
MDALSGTELDARIVHKILKSLSNPRYRARTVEGIAYETELPEESVRECLENHILSVKHTEQGTGQVLYSFRCNKCGNPF